MMIFFSSSFPLQAVWRTLASAFNPPTEEPPRNKCQWDFVLQEAAWLAHDVMQVCVAIKTCFCSGCTLPDVGSVYAEHGM